MGSSTPDHRVRSLIKDLPTHPGVYQMLDECGTIIYIGKAKNIKQRVSQYFVGKRDLKTHVMVGLIHSIRPIITKTEHDALLLENQLIKQHQPRFNVLLKDDKTYPYIKITLNDPFPRILITRQKKNDGAKYFGPYTTFGSTKKLRQVLHDLFPIRDCKQHIDRVTHQKKCIQLDLGNCIGPCIYKNTFDEYQHHIKQCILFLNGKSRDIIDALTNDMLALSTQQAYEKAALIRNKIQLLESIQSQQHVDLDSNDDHFFIGFSTNERFHYVVCQHFSNKRFISQHGHYAPLSVSFDAFCAAFFNHFSDALPDSSTIVVDSQMLPVAQEHLDHQEKTTLHSPKKGRYAELLTMAQLNAQKSLIGLSKQDISPSPRSVLDLLKTDVGLQQQPRIIFGCDISHFYGQQIVSSVVVFIDGQPAKKWYRHFNIASVTSGKSNDVKAMKETVLRLMEHFEMAPDLLLIDGGKGQLNAALEALNSRPQPHPHCIALAKKNELIFTPFKPTPLKLPYHHAGLNLLRFVRDEAHRFALKFQRSKRHGSSSLQ